MVIMQWIAVDVIKPSARNARTHLKKYDTTTTRSEGLRPRNQAGRATEAHSDFRFLGGKVIIRRRTSRCLLTIWHHVCRP
jgi:hypothetical protein